MCDYLTKPFLPEDLLAVLARNLGSAETEDYRESA
jgi:DNA-binding response OmpR family regulator